ncbi:hypothetical protein BCR32DRAFT_248925 [Anaeromyces robustus]|uniref:Uncharacterized protein n=1 Tax=Anaeromyces robustus TaxID=1754192 RepID=A0A1Y1WRP3_9FUNG|nr:hypothetical protein BCR32DRAFT_248925 [Anaeromyces robustus]|eukprot:ORX76207.1 hypothetical protein BCR32DRAFT_248925 [Anaeromyces robustus]
MESLNISYDNLIIKHNNIEKNAERLFNSINNSKKEWTDFSGQFTFKLENIIELAKEYEILWKKNITDISKNLDGIKNSLNEIEMKKDSIILIVDMIQNLFYRIIGNKIY